MYLVFVVILIGLPLAALAFGLWSTANEIYVYAINSINHRMQIRQPLSEKYRQILRKYFAYYNVLSSTEKQEFERRLVRFMYSKNFIARGIPLILDDMKVLISATAVQLTFGLPQVYLANFDKILVYPDEYYSHISKRYHLGEVNPRAGIIVISWKAFVAGLGDLNDSLNVGIHEMAHAIHFENRIRNSEYDFLDQQAILKLKTLTDRETSKIIVAPETHFLRRYAATNEYEFFAVALEYFFEQPLELQQNIPDLYATLKQLLNQDPIKLYNLA